LKLSVERVLEHRAAEMRSRTDTRRAVVQLAGIGLGVSDEGLSRIHGKILARDQDQRDLRNQRDIHKIGQRIVRRLFAIEERVGMGGDGAEQCRVSVGGRPHDTLSTDRPAPATQIFNDDTLAQARRHAFGHDAGEHIDRAARRGRHYHGDRPARIVFRPDRARQQQ
jgi:hypothetical protein